MSKASSLIKKLDGVLNKYCPPFMTVYKRQITYGYGDQLIGRALPNTYQDTLLSPQPYYNRMGRERIPGGHAQAIDVVSSGKQTLADDYMFIFSPTAITRDELQDPNISIFFKYPTGEEEPLRLTDMETPGISGTEVIFICYMRSIKRPA